MGMCTSRYPCILTPLGVFSPEGRPAWKEGASGCREDGSSAICLRKNAFYRFLVFLCRLLPVLVVAITDSNAGGQTP